MERKTLNNIVQECLAEMYKKAQPSVDILNAIKNKEKIDYKMHYLSKEEYEYILDKYIDNYNLKSNWDYFVEVIENSLIKGGLKESKNEEGESSFERIKPLEDQILELVENKDLTKDIINLIFKNIKEIKNNHRFNYDEQYFLSNVSMNAPMSNKEFVKKYYKEKNQTLNIEDRNPLLFWEYDNYVEEMDEVMTLEYGKDWKEVWNEKWKNKNKDI